MARLSPSGVEPAPEHVFSVGEFTARIQLQRNRKAEPIFRYWFGKNRVDRQALTVLACSELRCPQRNKLMQRWLEHNGEAAPKVIRQSSGLQLCVLAREEQINTAVGRFFARVATFPVTIVCPQRAHEAMKLSVTGWDLFDEIGYVSGGLEGGRPRFETLEQAHAWIDEHVSRSAQSAQSAPH